MEKLARKLVEVAVETADEPALEGRCIQALSKLHSLRVPNKFFLLTDAGNLIHSLKSNPRPVIRDYADRVFTRWMRQLYSHARPRKPSTPAPAISKPAPNLKAQNKTKALRNPNPKAAACFDKLKIPKEVQDKSPDVPDQMRQNIGQQIFEGLNMSLQETKLNSSQFDAVGIAMLVESTLFQVWGKNCQKYRSFLYNLKDPKNPDFRRKILTGKLKPEKIATLRAEDMASDQKRIENHFIREAALNKCIVGRQVVC